MGLDFFLFLTKKRSWFGYDCSLGNPIKNPKVIPMVNPGLINLHSSPDWHPDRTIAHEFFMREPMGSSLSPVTVPFLPLFISIKQLSSYDVQVAAVFLGTALENMRRYFLSLFHVKNYRLKSFLLEHQNFSFPKYRFPLKQARVVFFLSSQSTSVLHRWRILGNRINWFKLYLNLEIFGKIRNLTDH